jgi:hypothetical protein
MQVAVSRKERKTTKEIGAWGVSRRNLFVLFRFFRPVLLDEFRQQLGASSPFTLKTAVK